MLIAGEKGEKLFFLGALPFTMTPFETLNFLGIYIWYADVSLDETEMACKNNIPNSATWQGLSFTNQFCGKERVGFNSCTSICF